MRKYNTHKHWRFFVKQRKQYNLIVAKKGMKQKEMERKKERKRLSETQMKRKSKIGKTAIHAPNSAHETIYIVF